MDYNFICGFSDVIIDIQSVGQSTNYCTNVTRITGS